MHVQGQEVWDINQTIIINNNIFSELGIQREMLEGLRGYDKDNSHNIKREGTYQPSNIIRGSLSTLNYFKSLICYYIL